MVCSCLRLAKTPDDVLRCWQEKGKHQCPAVPHEGDGCDLGKWSAGSQLPEVGGVARGSGLVEMSLINREKMNKVIAAAALRCVEWWRAAGPGSVPLRQAGRRAVSADIPLGHPSSLFVQTGASVGRVSARGGAASGTAGPEPCAADTKIVTANQVLGNLNRLKKHSKLGEAQMKREKF